jgi:PAS domain-containing protein
MEIRVGPGTASLKRCNASRILRFRRGQADNRIMVTDQRPVELILARGLMANITTPAFLVDPDGTLVFFNDGAGDLLGLRYEDTGPMDFETWSTRFNPLGEEGRPLRAEELPLAIALRDGRPVHRAFEVRTAQGSTRKIEVSAFPIVGNAGMRGAMAIFWDAGEQG